MFWWEQALGEPRMTPPERMNDEWPVDRERNGLANARVFQHRIASVEGNVIEDRAGAGVDRNVRVFLEGVDLVGAEGVDANVGRAFLQFQCASDLVRDDGESDALDASCTGRRRRPIGGVALNDDFLVLLLRDEAEWAAADGMAAKVAAAPGGDDADSAVGEIR